MNSPISKNTCRDCGNVDEFDASMNSLDACTKCSSKNIDTEMYIKEVMNVQVADSMRGKIKDDSYPSKKKTRVDVFAGKDQRKSDGKWMDKERRIDKDNDRYKEKVVDPSTGEVIRDVDESLSDHQGHGSDKFKK